MSVFCIGGRMRVSLVMKTPQELLPALCDWQQGDSENRALYGTIAQSYGSSVFTGQQ